MACITEQQLNAFKEKIDFNIKVEDSEVYHNYSRTIDYDKLDLTIKKSQYFGYKEGYEIIVEFGEHDICDDTPSPSYFSVNQERFPFTSIGIEVAINAFMKRFNSSRPSQPSGFGLSYDLVFEKE